MHAHGDVRVQQREDPKILEPTDAIIRVAATCVRGSDLWSYRGIDAVHDSPMGHEYIGIVEQVGGQVKSIKPGDFVICDQFVDRTYSREQTFFDGPRVVHVSTADPYCPELRQHSITD